VLPVLIVMFSRRGLPQAGRAAVEPNPAE